MRIRIRDPVVKISGINRMTDGIARSTAEERAGTAGTASTVFR